MQYDSKAAAFEKTGNAYRQTACLGEYGEMLGKGNLPAEKWFEDWALKQEDNAREVERYVWIRVMKRRCVKRKGIVYGFERNLTCSQRRQGEQNEPID